MQICTHQSTRILWNLLSFIRLHILCHLHTSQKYWHKTIKYSKSNFPRICYFEFLFISYCKTNFQNSVDAIIMETRWNAFDWSEYHQFLWNSAIFQQIQFDLIGLCLDFVGFYRILFDSTGFHWFQLDSVGYVSLGFTGFTWIPVNAIEFRTLLESIWFFGFHWINWVPLDLTEFRWIPLDFVWFRQILLVSIGFCYMICVTWIYSDSLKSHWTVLNFAGLC